MFSSLNQIGDELNTGPTLNSTTAAFHSTGATLVEVNRLLNTLPHRLRRLLEVQAAVTHSPPADVPTTALPQVLQSQVFLHSSETVGEFLKTTPEVKGGLKVKVVILQQRGCEMKLSLVPLYYTTRIKKEKQSILHNGLQRLNGIIKNVFVFFLLSLTFVQKPPRNKHLMVHILPSCRDISLICRYVYLKIFF